VPPADDGTTRKRVTIELQRLEDPIAGTIQSGAGPPESFLGWTGLLAALQGALGATRP
jgi:hypothetical protein